MWMKFVSVCLGVGVVSSAGFAQSGRRVIDLGEIRVQHVLGTEYGSWINRVMCSDLDRNDNGEVSEWILGHLDPSITPMPYNFRSKEEVLDAVIRECVNFAHQHGKTMETLEAAVAIVNVARERRRLARYYRSEELETPTSLGLGSVSCRSYVRVAARGDANSVALRANYRAWIHGYASNVFHFSSPRVYPDFGYDDLGEYVPYQVTWATCKRSAEDLTVAEAAKRAVAQIRAEVIAARQQQPRARPRRREPLDAWAPEARPATRSSRPRNIEVLDPWGN